MATELESLIVRMIGDNSNYLKSLKQAQSATVSAATNINSSVNSVTTATSGVGETVKNTVDGMQSSLGLLENSFAQISIAATAITVSFQAIETEVIALDDMYRGNQSTVLQFIKAYGKIVISVIGLAGGFALLYSRLGVIIPTLKIVAGVFFGPIGMAILFVVGLVSSIIEAFGGWIVVMYNVKKEVGEIWPFISSAIKTVWSAVGDAAKAMYDVIISVFNAIAGFIKETWGSVAGDSQITWAQIKDYIIDTFLYIEFVVKNFGAYWRLWLLEAFVLWETFIGQLQYGWDNFIAVFDGVMSYIEKLWPYVWNNLEEWTQMLVKNIGRAFYNLGENIVNIFTNLPDIIAGRADWSKILVPLTRDFEYFLNQAIYDAHGNVIARVGDRVGTIADSVQRRLAAVRMPGLSEDAQRAQEQIDGIGRRLGQSWLQFRRSRRQAQEEFEDYEDNSAQRLVQRYELASLSSMEAISRILEYREKLEDKPSAARPPALTLDARYREIENRRREEERRQRESTERTERERVSSLGSILQEARDFEARVEAARPGGSMLGGVEARLETARLAAAEAAAPMSPLGALNQQRVQESRRTTSILAEGAEFESRISEARSRIPGRTPAEQRNDAMMTQTLIEIRNYLRTLAGRQTVEVQPANIGG